MQLFARSFHPNRNRFAVEGCFPTVQINISHINNNIMSSSHGISEQFPTANIVSVVATIIQPPHSDARAAFWDTALKISPQSRAMTSPDHLEETESKKDQVSVHIREMYEPQCQSIDWSAVKMKWRKEKDVHYTFADNFAPYFLLIFSPIFVLTCLFGIFYTYLTTEVSFLF